MRSGVWLWLVSGLAISGCAGDYPLEPTPCDDYCHATKNFECDFYAPASCVRECESRGTGDEACRPRLHALFDCLRSSPNAIDSRCTTFGYSSSYGDGPCDAQILELEVCASSFGPDVP